MIRMDVCVQAIWISWIQVGVGLSVGVRRSKPPFPKTLWPDHCVAETEGSKFHPSLVIGIHFLFKMIHFDSQFI